MYCDGTSVIFERPASGRLIEAVVVVEQVDESRYRVSNSFESYKIFDHLWYDITIRDRVFKAFQSFKGRRLFAVSTFV